MLTALADAQGVMCLGIGGGGDCVGAGQDHLPEATGKRIVLAEPNPVPAALAAL